MCQTGLKLLARSDGVLGRLRWRLHARLCAACRDLRAAERSVEAYVSRAGQWEAPTSLAAPAPARPVPSHAVGKETGTMKRLVYVSAIVVALAIGAAVIVPRGSAPDADSILAGAAEAMELAQSVYILGRGTEGASESPTGNRLSSGYYERWCGEGAVYDRSVTADGTVRSAAGLDVAAGEWWYYRADDRACYVADVSPIRGEVADVVLRGIDSYARSGLIDMVEQLGGDAPKTVEIEDRDGREVAVVSVTYPYPQRPDRPQVTGRMVFEVDCQTDRLLRMRQYAQADGHPEQLVGAVDKLEYDVPLPADLRTSELPPGTRTVPASADVEQADGYLSLVMRVDGTVIVRKDVPGD
jgi:hypothetical protein